MKRISMSEFRRQPGEFILDVIRDGKSFLLTKAGKPVARLLPPDDGTVIEPDGTIKGEPPLSAAFRQRRPEGSR